jgi:hypothetical protein
MCRDEADPKPSWLVAPRRFSRSSRRAVGMDNPTKLSSAREPRAVAVKTP